MTTSRTEHLREEPSGAVDDRELRVEARRTRHEPEHGQHPFAAIERSQLGPQDGERIAGAPPSRLGTLLDGHVDTEDSRVHQLPVVATRELTRRADDPAVHHHRVEWLVRRLRPGQRDAESGETVVDGHGAAVLIRGAVPIGGDATGTRSVRGWVPSPPGSERWRRVGQRSWPRTAPEGYASLCTLT